MDNIMLDKELENKLQKLTFNDSIPDFDRFWNDNLKNSIKEGSMAEKKGGSFKIITWAVSFLVVAAIGWLAITKFSSIKTQEKIEKGEAIVVTLVVGDVDVKKMGANSWRKALIEDNLEMGDSVKTGNDSYCELQMVKRGIFRVEGSSEIYLAKLINEDEKVNSRMKLSKGGVALKPNKLEEGENFEVETSTAVVAVRGTKFSVNIDDNGNTKVAVKEGKVSVRPVINSIDEAQKKGLVDEKSSDLIKNEVVKPIEVNSGEEATLEKTKVEALNNAIGRAIESVAKEEGGKITSEKTTNEEVTAKEGAQPPITIASANIIAKVQEETAVSTGNAVSAETPLTSAAVQKQEISEEAKNKLDTLTENNIINKVTDMVKIKFDPKPSGSEIFINDVSIGNAPLEKIMEKGKKISVRISKDRYIDFTKDVNVAPGLTFNIELKKKEIQEATNTNVTSLAETNTNIVALATNMSHIVSNIPASNKIVSNLIQKKPVIEAKKLPGDLAWEKPLALKVSGFDYEPVLYRGKIFATANNKLLILSTDGRLLKTTDIVDEGFKLTKAAIDEGIIYLGSDNGGLFAYSADGELLWKKEAGSQKYGAAPAAAYGIIAIPSIDKGIQVYSKNGDLIGNIDVTVPIYSAPLIINNGKSIVYVTENGEVICYDMESKSKKWSKNYNDRILYPLVGDDSIIVTLTRNTGKVLGINPADGSTLWTGQFNEIQKTKLNPQFIPGKVILANNSGTSTVIVLNSATGELIAKSSLDEVISAPFIVDNSIYMGTQTGKVYSYNFKQKNNEWTFKSGKKNILLVAGDNEGIYAVSAGSMVKIIK